MHIHDESAYPTTAANHAPDYCSPGMSLRDHFAAQVIGPAFLDLFDGWRKNGEPVQEDWPMGLAIDAYRVADAMLRVRSQGDLDAS